jgi:hypothetical protein
MFDQWKILNAIAKGTNALVGYVQSVKVGQDA